MDMMWPEQFRVVTPPRCHAVRRPSIFECIKFWWWGSTIEAECRCRHYEGHAMFATDNPLQEPHEDVNGKRWFT